MSFHSRVLFSALLFLSSLFMISAHAQPASGTIIAEQLSGRCIGVGGSSQADGANVIQWDCVGVEDQRFAFNAVGSAFQIIADHSGKCLAVENTSNTQGASVVQYSCSQDPSMLWSVEGEGNDQIIRANHSNMCLNVAGRSAANGANIVQWPCAGGINEKWAINAGFDSPIEPPIEPPVEPPVEPPIADKPNFAPIMAEQLSGKCIGVGSSSLFNNADVVQWECIDEQDQSFAFLKVDNGFRIVAEHSGKCLAVENASQTPGASIRQYDCEAADHFTWIVQGEGNDQTLRVAHTGMCMNVAGVSVADGADIVQWPCGGGINEKWAIGSALDTTPVKPSIWTEPQDLPLVAVAAANLPSGQILLWSAYSKSTFGGERGFTQTALFNPITGIVTEKQVVETNHDMFCPGISQLADGRWLISGGSNAAVSSIYEPQNDTWTQVEDLNIARGYHGQTTLADGSALTIGGSWSGPNLDKIGEVWSQGQGWVEKPGISGYGLETADISESYRADNHMWLFQAANGLVFHAGPSKLMNWIDINGEGNVLSAGLRDDDNDAMNGNAVMYDVDKILVLGGAQDYDNGQGTNNAYTIDISAGVGNVVVEKLTGMIHQRTLHNSVVLPNGEVVIVGGQSISELFSDKASVFNAEIWSPETGLFTELAPMAIPRNYHAVALLLQDGRIAVAGSGLCGEGCPNNHFEIEMLTPPYLLNQDGTAAARSIITSAPDQLSHGDASEIQVDSTGEHSFALVRLSAPTHSVNNDQRRIPLDSVQIASGRFQVNIPNNPNIVTPGNYFLFALNSAGVPSIAKTINIR